MKKGYFQVPKALVDAEVVEFIASGASVCTVRDYGIVLGFILGATQKQINKENKRLEKFGLIYHLMGVVVEKIADEKGLHLLSEMSANPIAATLFFNSSINDYEIRFVDTTLLQPSEYKEVSIEKKIRGPAFITASRKKKKHPEDLKNKNQKNVREFAFA